MAAPRPQIPWAELAERYVRALGDRWLWLAVVLVVLLVLAVLARFGRPRLHGWRAWLALAPVVLFGVIWAWTLRWICDDAFISFRYAENWIAGKGLVFNEGERVEGYTNFLWTIAMGLSALLRIGPVVGSLVLSLASFGALIALGAKLAREHAPAGSPAVVPFAAVVVASSYTCASYGTSGLETMCAAMLALLALERAIAKRLLASGLAGIAATMAHPDHAIFYGSLFLALLVDGERRRHLLRFVAPFVLVYVPYFIWRFSYYGDFFPNTYYAKSANLSYFSQGWVYVAVCTAAGGLFGLLPLAFWGAVLARQKILARYAVLSTIVYSIYVAKIGGDFMLGRLLVPLVAPLAILADVGALGLIRARLRFAWLALPGLAFMALAAVPTRIIGHLEKVWHIADERSFYPLVSVRPLVIDSVYQASGEALRRHVGSKGVPVRIAASSVGIIGYVSKLPVVDTYGLADRTVARQTLAQRGRPGHEKVAGPGYLAARGIDIAELPVFPEPYLSTTQLYVSGNRYFMPRFRADFADAMRGDRQVSLVDAREMIDRYDPIQGGRPLDAILCDAWFFDVYYFRHNDDPERLRELRRRIASSHSSLAGLEGLLVGDPDPTVWERGPSFEFESAAEGWTSFGAAFDPWPREREFGGQTQVLGQVGKYACSFTRRAGDAATGELVSPEFEIVGDVITLEMGGGIDPEHVRVTLLVDGETVFSVTGCESEILGRRVWNVAALSGKRATIAIVDGAKGPWGHVVVDTIVQWKRRPGR